MQKIRDFVKGFKTRNERNLLKWAWKQELIRFFGVAALNIAFGYSFYAFLLYIGVHYTMATLIGQIVGIFFNFKTYGTFVFKNKNNRVIFKFIGVYVSTYFLNVSGIYLLQKLPNITDYLAGAIMVVPIGLLNYTLMRIFVFKKV